ncbi:chymotrypsin-like elastase family member 2A [Onthophagus taurus]|uniref:chymotrypsin-like elastase family member 2A n=1 Tax=Onthophagus taurus TaxID=166361 RepID=UPI000C20EEF2|nr:chymotrypsin-like elastase family member 2A [Onthophagus taurus]
MKCFRVIATIFLALQVISAFTIVSESSQRIINGQNVYNGSYFGHTVSIERGMNGFWQHVCGGAIIANRAILTAASCVANFNAIYRVRAGILNLNEPLTLGQTINVQTYRIFETNPINQLHNIAVLILRTPLIIPSENVSLIRVPPANWGQTALPNPSVAILTGWGATNATSPGLSERLQAANITFTNTCTDFAPAQSNYIICSAAPAPGTNVPTGCMGDMGSPLVLGDQVIGILARYIRPCNSRTDMYARVNTFRVFIETTLRDFNMNLN